VENATVAKNTDVEASVVHMQSERTRHAIVFVLENYSDAAVKVCHCDVLKPYGFTRCPDKGRIEPG